MVHINYKLLLKSPYGNVLHKSPTDKLWFIMDGILLFSYKRLVIVRNPWSPSTVLEQIGCIQPPAVLSPTTSFDCLCHTHYWHAGRQAGRTNNSSCRKKLTAHSLVRGIFNGAQFIAIWVESWSLQEEIRKMKRPVDRRTELEELIC